MEVRIFGSRYRYFDGMRYKFFGRYEKRNKANDIAEKLRNNNHRARVVECESDYSGSWYVYVR